VRIIDFGLSYDYNNLADFVPQLSRGKHINHATNQHWWVWLSRGDKPRDSLLRHGEWDWLIKRVDFSSLDSIRQADFLIDDTRVEAIIDEFAL
jgi:hypothetical protein